jgi:hypothetical protein
MRQIQPDEVIHDARNYCLKALEDVDDVRRVYRREQQRENRRTKRSVHTDNFSFGDYVQVAKREFRICEKLTLRWKEPKRIVGILSDYVSDVKDLRNGKVSTVNAQRLRLYQDASLNATPKLVKRVAHNEQRYEVQVFKKLKFVCI